MNVYGLHPLSRKGCAGRYHRHSVLKDITRCAIYAEPLSFILKLVGLDRGGGNVSIAWQFFPIIMMSVIWDDTYIDSFASSAINVTATNNGHVSIAAARR